MSMFLPERIWLQRDASGDVKWSSWGVERLNDDDVEYVRAPASGEPSGAGAVVREAKATPLSDTAVARIIEAVEKHCGMGHGAWDMVSARDLVEGFAAALGADTRRIDALDNMLRRWQSWARLAVAHIPSAAPMVREQYDALLTDTAIVRAAHQRLTAPDTQTEGDDVE